MRSNTRVKTMALGLAAMGVAGLSTVSIAWACSIGMDQERMTILEEEPTEPVDLPPAVTLRQEYIKRSQTPQREGCSERVTSCDDTAFLKLSVQGYDPEAGGLRFAIEGDYPDTLTIDPHPLVLYGEDRDVLFVWSDMDTMYEPIDATITATWVDAWGREGETSAPVQVRNDGARGGGCAVAGGAGSTGALVLGAAIGAMLLSRRRRVSP
ncbi:hypothetical protein DV096_20225 [Bradymonadaceae bacterium TMQ3]|uniref:Uncharacterized protein n=1 Tax=Lujinxingia sediminis TaxID=2480984 RepID=A0ABY0CP13_9DELT|nr:hypothetical protein [Lujinxingia sediminis]RDV36248.1 hypothetical protein DV096_20225 [Bradymonadaceae bacterium TMQ3]RVU40993.1 hypothetical protein EA187_19640 [Lujinxingia sediminis]TXC67692.1 hypothetical protein FRC91_19895 [Bradymonadales bacterium TMQ1]